MNTSDFRIKKITGLLLVLIVGLVACVDQDFDKPDPMDIPVGEVLTIAEMKQMINDTIDRIKFDADMSIYGVITMDGSSGNIYRGAFMEDATGAINLRLMSPGGLYQGDSIRINLRGTVLSEFAQMLQLDSVHTGNNVVKLATRIDLEPAQTDIATLLNDPSYEGRLIKLHDVEFSPADVGNKWADAANLQAINRNLRDCSGNSIIVRTSGYASFADEIIPEGNGSMVAIMSRHNNDRQLFIRSLSEVNLDGPRCSEQDHDNIISLAELRHLFNEEGATAVPAGTSVRGVITSDIDNGNIFPANAFLQDETGAIALRFSGNHGFKLGDEITIFAGGIQLSRFNGLLQLNNIPAENVTLEATGIVVQPVVATIDEILSNFQQFESMLVTVHNASIEAGGTFQFNKTLTDGTGSINLFTREDASFFGESVPSSTFSVTANVSIFNNEQLIMRSLDDIEQ